MSKKQYSFKVTITLEEGDCYTQDEVKENVGTIMNPELVWFGGYYKYERN